jgi:putative ABC transport system substrate-binding protein
MDRRRFLVTSLAGAVAAPLGAGAQAPTRVLQVGEYFGGQAIPAVIGAFAARLADLGFVNGQNIRIEERSAVPTPEDMLAVAKALVGLPVDVLVSWGTVASTAARQATRTIPVVFLSVSDPVTSGLVASLARPGGNMTGVTFDAASETAAKRLQILMEVVPRISRVGVLHAQHDPNVAAQLEAIRRVESTLRVHLVAVGFESAEDIDLLFARFQAQGVQGLVVLPGALTFVNRVKIADLALAHRLPSSHAFRETVAAGGLVSLGPNYVDMAKQGATLVAKILKGARPADLPVEQPTKFELVINLKTAKSLGLTIPPSLLARADQVIE